MLSALLACLLARVETIPPELDAYMKRPDPSFAWSLKKPGLTPLHIRMTSQTWQNVRWSHDIVVVFPEKASGDGHPVPGNKAKDSGPAASDVAILYITGGDPNPADLDEARRLAGLSKMPVALLHHIPNQPLFGKNEDDLIAHTFERYLQTHEAGWVLLFPMVKSAVRAMDAIQEASKPLKHPIKRFVVIGASKRGWTAWLVGALQDKRVIGIAPMVFDNLRFKEQLKHQLDSWGKYSEMIADYTDKGLDKVLDTPSGSKLVGMVDPWSYRSRITIPKLLVTGSNDRYWTVDAMSLYWDGLVGPKYCSIVPNAGHLLGDMKQALAAIAGFARSCAGEFQIPARRDVIEVESGSERLRLSVDDPMGIVKTENTSSAPVPTATIAGVWVASSVSGDFRDALWSRETFLVLAGAGRIGGAYVAKPPKGVRLAMFGEFTVQYGDLAFSLSTPVRVVR